MKDCLFCNQQLEEISRVPSKAAYACDCVGCGKYSVTDPFVASLKSAPLSPEKKARIAAVLYARKDKSQPISITTTDGIQELLAQYPERVDEKLNKELFNLGKRFYYLGQVVKISHSDQPLLYALNLKEYEAILSALRNTGYITYGAAGTEGKHYDIKITPKGYERIYELRKTRVDSHQAFVAMWFDPSLDNIYKKGFAKAIEDAGYKPIRIDKKPHNNIIDNEMIAEIKRSKFLVADFTDHRRGVYYEAGFARGLGIPVIFTCKKEAIKDAHFDTEHYSHLKWENETDLYQQLLNWISLTIV